MRRKVRKMREQRHRGLLANVVEGILLGAMVIPISLAVLAVGYVVGVYYFGFSDVNWLRDVIGFSILGFVVGFIEGWRI